MNTIAKESVTELAERNGEPGWLKEFRLSSWEAYLQTPMPTLRSESWRRTIIDALDLSTPEVVDADSTIPSWAQDILKRFGAVPAAVVGSKVVTLDEAAFAELKKRGVIFCTLEEALSKHADLVKPYLTERFQGHDHHFDAKFTLMNKALCNTGTFLYVPDGVEVPVPFFAFTLLPEERRGKKAIAVFPRLIVGAGRNAKANVVNILSTSAAGTAALPGSKPPYSLANAFIQVHVGEGANVSYLELQKFPGDTFSVTQIYNEVARDGQFNSFTVGMGGAQLKSDIATLLQDRGASSDIQGVVLGDGEEHFSFNTIQEHNAPDTRSNIMFRVALKDKATSVYLGNIRVDKSAQRTDAFQQNKNLLLGTQARADSIPKLEILADDVKCSHGATVGPVDQEQIFYLMSRGLSRGEAEELIVTGFFRKVVDTLTLPGAADWINDLVTEKIHREV